MNGLFSKMLNKILKHHWVWILYNIIKIKFKSNFPDTMVIDDDVFWNFKHIFRLYLSNLQYSVTPLYISHLFTFHIYTLFYLWFDILENVLRLKANVSVIRFLFIHHFTQSLNRRIIIIYGNYFPWRKNHWHQMQMWIFSNKYTKVRENMDNKRNKLKSQICSTTLEDIYIYLQTMNWNLR